MSRSHFKIFWKGLSSFYLQCVVMEMVMCYNVQVWSRFQVEWFDVFYCIIQIYSGVLTSSSEVKLQETACRLA